jgi:hypothetical protein
MDSPIGSAPGFRVARTSGVESDMELAFDALQPVRAPMLDRMGQLSPILRVAWASRSGDERMRRNGG